MKTKQEIDPTVTLLAGIVGASVDDFLILGALPEPTPEETPTMQPRMTGVLALRNQPEFWADAPWRLEPDQHDVPVTFYIRDAAVDSPGFSPWRLEKILIELSTDGAVWKETGVYQPSDLPGLDPQGNIAQNFWFCSVHLPLAHMQPAQPGERLRFKVTFFGRPHPFRETVLIERHLDVLLAPCALPLSRADQAPGARTWFYGDTHYHTAYSNDIKEFGGPVPETRAAGLAVGLDWIVVTDHSCDLDEVDAEGNGLSRWERLKAEIASPQVSDETLRFILGEEITLVGEGDSYVHMLAMGHLQKLIPGSFLPDESEHLLVAPWIQALKNILRFGKGYPANLISSMFGKVYALPEVLAMVPKETLLFAAHPYGIAQVPPARWDEGDLANLRLTGHEFWNTRIRRKAVWTANPFQQPGWAGREKVIKADASRIRKLREAARCWDVHLQRGVDEWDPAKALPDRRPVFIGGSDAHGDFNYHAGMAWDYTAGNALDDNALGKVRTAIYLPDHPNREVPEEGAILVALRKGSCAVTDGPVLESRLCQGSRVANMGECLAFDPHAAMRLEIKAHTTFEFGPVAEARVILYTSGPGGGRTTVHKVQPGQQKTSRLSGSCGYVRLEAQTSAANGEQFCCFTNPIWFRLDRSQSRSLHILLSQDS